MSAKMGILGVGTTVGNKATVAPSMLPLSREHSKNSPCPSPLPSPSLSTSSSWGSNFRTLPPSSPKPGKHHPPLSRHTTSTQATSKTDKTLTHVPSNTTAPLFPDEILPGLFISDLETAWAVVSPKYAAPGRPNIKYILTIIETPAEQPRSIDEAFGAKFVKKLLPLKDDPQANLLQFLPEAMDFIQTSLEAKDGDVLVHCRKGISRSGSVMVAYVMKSMFPSVPNSYPLALSYVQAKRAAVLPNHSFRKQLTMWKELEFALVDENGQEKPDYARALKEFEMHMFRF